jgi:hypothetical protein
VKPQFEPGNAQFIATVSVLLSVTASSSTSGWSCSCSLQKLVGERHRLDGRERE